MAKQSYVRGDAQLVKNLRALAKGPSPRELDEAARFSMNPMLEKTKHRAREHRDYNGKWPGFPQPAGQPSGGHVDQGIVFRVVGKSGGKRMYRLGATKRARFLLHLLEFGSAPHFQPNLFGGFMHPGAQPNPVLIPSFEEEKARVTKTFGNRIWDSYAARIARMKKA